LRPSNPQLARVCYHKMTELHLNNMACC
jgi:hypothetical protein